MTLSFDLSKAPPFAEGGTLVNLAAAIASRFGKPGSLSQLASAPLSEAIDRARCVVLLLFDGLGRTQINRLLPTGFLCQARLAQIDSVFPSSTAPAVTSLATALTPAQHEVTGWHLWWERAHAIVRPLPLDFRSKRGAVNPLELFDWQPIAQTLGHAMHVLQPASIAHSPFSIHAFGRQGCEAYSSLQQLRRKILEAVRNAPAHGRYVYAYLPHFDSAAHEFGCASVEAAAVAERFNTLFVQLTDDLRGEDTLLLAGADHGFIDIAPEHLLRLENFPKVAAQLAAPLSGEPRVAFCHPKPAHSAELVAAASDQLGHAFDCVETRALIDAGWFGPPQSAGRRLQQRIGTHALIAREDYCLVQTLAGETPAQFIGMHGGVHEDERLITISATCAGRPLAAAPSTLRASSHAH